LLQLSGPAHIRNLGAADLKKVGVEGFRSTDFHRGEPVEVPDLVGQALIQGALFGNFAEADATQVNSAELPQGVVEALPQAFVPSQAPEPDVDAVIDEALADVPDPSVVQAVEEPTITELPSKPARKSSKS
jgi:hypothetical protein